ncbi:DUF4062 domain-containing protein [Rossellomorea marisflavi]|uniref:DUF4062 domain-containing protein n=1 Tax=Rossellomorea marisflavi TaxID=189381 RepID=UPI00345A044A
MDKKFQVFVSSTYLDLINERQKAVEGILRSKHIPAGMELFIPSDKSQWEIIKEWIRDSDILLLVLGGRYGTIEPVSGKSYTQLEYEYACENDIPVCAIVLNEQFLATKKYQDISLKVYEHEIDTPSIEKYNNFKQLVTSNFVSFVDDINQIPTEVSFILSEFKTKDKEIYQFRGWVRGKEKLNPLMLNVKYNIEKFLDDKARQGLTDDTIKGYFIELRIFEKYFEEIILINIDTMKIKEYLKHREDNYSIKAKTSMERSRGILNVFFDWLVEEGIVEKNPVRKVKPYKYYKKGNDSLTDNEVGKLRAACKTARQGALLEFFISTGCKLSEIENIKISNINWENKTLKIPTKEEDRIVFITINAEKQIKKYLEVRDDNLDNLFVTERKTHRQLSKRGIQREIDVLVKESDINKKISPKTLRNTFTKNMLGNGYGYNIVESLLGYHAKKSRSETYFIVTEENIWDILHSRPEF